MRPTGVRRDVIGGTHTHSSPLTARGERRSKTMPGRTARPRATTTAAATYRLIDLLEASAAAAAAAAAAGARCEEEAPRRPAPRPPSPSPPPPRPPPSPPPAAELPPRRASWLLALHPDHRRHVRPWRDFNYPVLRVALRDLLEQPVVVTTTAAAADPGGDADAPHGEQTWRGGGGERMSAATAAAGSGDGHPKAWLGASTAAAAATVTAAAAARSDGSRHGSGRDDDDTDRASAAAAAQQLAHQLIRTFRLSPTSQQWCGDRDVDGRSPAVLTLMDVGRCGLKDVMVILGSSHDHGGDAGSPPSRPGRVLPWLQWVPVNLPHGSADMRGAEGGLGMVLPSAADAVVIGVHRTAEEFPLSALERFRAPDGSRGQQRQQQLDERVERTLCQVGTVCWHARGRPPYAFVLTPEGAALLMFSAIDTPYDVCSPERRSKRKGRGRRRGRRKPAARRSLDEGRSDRSSDLPPALGVRYALVPWDRPADACVLTMPLIMSLWTLSMVAEHDPDCASWNGDAARLNTWRESVEGRNRWYSHAWLPQRNRGRPPGAKVISEEHEKKTKVERRAQGARKRGGEHEYPGDYVRGTPSLDTRSGPWSGRLRPRKKRPNYRD